MNLTQACLLFALFTIAYTSCDTNNATCSENISCDSLLHLIVLSTDIDSPLKNKEVIEDGIINDTVLVKIYHRNEVEPGAFFDAADCFLMIDLNNLKAYRTLVEFDSNVEIKSSRELIKCYRYKCRGHK